MSTDRSALVQSVEFYYTIGSRYSYLAATQMSALERDIGCRVHWIPIDSRALLSRQARDPFTGTAPSGQYEWSYRERESTATAAALDTTLEQAHSLGIFGVPTFVIEGQLFWGNDRIVLLRHHLLQRLAGQS
jgi:2-hydroxychromene-2-carboxylate isomerase